MCFFPDFSLEQQIIVLLSPTSKLKIRVLIHVFFVCFAFQIVSRKNPEDVQEVTV